MEGKRAHNRQIWLRAGQTSHRVIPAVGRCTNLPDQVSRQFVRRRSQSRMRCNQLKHANSSPNCMWPLQQEKDREGCCTGTT